MSCLSTFFAGSLLTLAKTFPDLYDGLCATLASEDRCPVSLSEATNAIRSGLLFDRYYQLLDMAQTDLIRAPDYQLCNPLQVAGVNQSPDSRVRRLFSSRFGLRGSVYSTTPIKAAGA